LLESASGSRSIPGVKIPFTPAVYENAARFTGRTPWEVSRDPELLFAGHRGAWLEYRHTPIAVGIDIYNLEAEAYGARVAQPGGNAVPAIHEPLLQSLDEGLDLPPFDPQRDGRIAMFLEVGRRLKRELPEADVRIPVAGPFSIAFNLRGVNQLCEDAALRPDDIARLLMRLAENQAGFCRAVAAAGLDVAFFESAAAPPMLSPRQFRALELPALKRMLAIAAECVGHPVPCIMGGNTYPILDDLLSTGTSYLVCNVETNQAAFVARVAQTHSHVCVRVNMNPVIVVCQEPERIYREIDRVLALTAGHKNCLLGTGALPFETPPENVRLIRKYVL
jgi:uroporphyrinogen decarboxylase